MTHSNDFHVAMNNGELQWVGNTVLDFGNNVQITIPFEARAYEQDNLPNLIEVERDTYAENLAQGVITDHSETINQIQDAVDKGLYGVV